MSIPPPAPQPLAPAPVAGAQAAAALTPPSSPGRVRTRLQTWLPQPAAEPARRVVAAKLRAANTALALLVGLLSAATWLTGLVDRHGHAWIGLLHRHAWIAQVLTTVGLMRAVGALSVVDVVVGSFAYYGASSTVLGVLDGLADAKTGWKRGLWRWLTKPRKSRRVALGLALLAATVLTVCGYILLGTAVVLGLGWNYGWL